MNQPTLIELIIMIVTFPLALADFLTTQILEFVFLDLLKLGASAMMM